MFVLFGPISKQKFPWTYKNSINFQFPLIISITNRPGRFLKTGGTLYSGARFVALWASCSHFLWSLTQNAGIWNFKHRLLCWNLHSIMLINWFHCTPSLSRQFYFKFHLYFHLINKFFFLDVSLIFTTHMLTFLPCSELGISANSSQIWKLRYICMISHWKYSPESISSDTNVRVCRLDFDL